MTASGPIGVLFVCHGNLCRSPLAEAIFRHKARERHLEDRFDIDSAGTYALDGRPAHPHSVEVARRHGVVVHSRSRAIGPEDLERFDHILAMDQANEADLLRLQRLAHPTTTPRIRRLLATPDAEPGTPLDVADPIGEAAAAYQSLWTVLEPACTRLLDELANELE